MRVRFVGGPLDGQSKDVRDDLTAESTIYWPPGADLTAQEDRVPGVDNVVEYLYRGDGSAEYVGGLLDQES